jgi:CheY-like chemotaxis protein
MPSDHTAAVRGHGELILAMNDDPYACHLIKTILEKHGYQVVPAKSGLESVNVFEKLQHKIKLLVSDPDLLFLDGITAIRTIQKLAPEIPIILTTSNPQNVHAIRSLNAARLAVLEKPYTVEQLLEAATRLIAPKKTKKKSDPASEAFVNAMLGKHRPAL